MNKHLPVIKSRIWLSSFVLFGLFRYFCLSKGPSPYSRTNVTQQKLYQTTNPSRARPQSPKVLEPSFGARLQDPVGRILMQLLNGLPQDGEVKQPKENLTFSGFLALGFHYKSNFHPWEPETLHNTFNEKSKTCKEQRVICVQDKRVKQQDVSARFTPNMSPYSMVQFWLAISHTFCTAENTCHWRDLAQLSGFICIRNHLLFCI